MRDSQGKVGRQSSKRKGIEQQEIEAKRVQERLRNKLTLSGLKESDFVSLAKRRFGIDSRTTRAYLNSERRVVQKDKVNKFEIILGCEPGELFEHDPLAIDAFAYVSGGNTSPDPSFSTPLDRAVCRFLTEEDFPKYNVWDGTAYERSIEGYQTDFGVESFCIYPHGIIGLYGDDLLGGLELWPIDKTGTAFLETGGFREERDFMPRHIRSRGSSEWYIASILKNPVIKSRLIGCMTAEKALRYWVENSSGHIEWPARLWAMPIHKIIETLCEVIGFSVKSKNKDGYPIYEKTLLNQVAATTWIDEEVSLLPRILLSDIATVLRKNS